MTLNKTLKGIAIAGIFSVFIIPFLVPSWMFFPFITGKGFFFRAVVEIMFAAWAVLAMRDPAYRPKKSAILWAFIAFAVVIAVADIFGQDPWKSFWSNFERMEGYITTIHLLFYFIVASTMLKTEKLWARFLEWSVWSSLLVACYSFLQLSGAIAVDQGGVRVDAQFGNAAYLAIFMVFNIFFALILISRKPELWKRWSFGVIGFLDLVILYYTATRGSILGLIGGLLLTGLIVAIWGKSEGKLRTASIWVVGAVVVLVLGFISIRNTSFVQKSPVMARFASISFNNAEDQARLFIWSMAIKGFEQRPILGWGQENFNYVFNQNYDARMYSQEQWFDHAHNVVLDWLVSGGILGLLAYLSLFGAAIYLLWKKGNGIPFIEKALLTGLGAAYFFHNLFVFDNLVSYILFAAVLGYIHWHSTKLAVPMAAEAESITDSESMYAVSIALVILVFVLYFFNGRAYMTNIDLIQGLRYSSANPPQADAALAYFQKAVSYDTLGRPEVIERLVQAIPQMNGSSVSDATRQQFFTMTKSAVDAQLSRFPGDARYEAFAGSFYEGYGDYADAETHFKSAVASSPKKQSLMFQLGGLYLSEKAYDQALTVFKQAYELDTNDTDALQYYALALVYAGQESAAKQALSSANVDSSLSSDDFVRAYINLGAWAKAEAILKARIVANPNDLTDMQSLAGVYYQAGDKADSLALLRQIETIDPSSKPQVDQYIQQVQGGK